MGDGVGADVLIRPGTESLSHGLRPCQLPFTREPALSVTAFGGASSPRGGAEGRGLRRVADSCPYKRPRKRV